MQITYKDKYILEPCGNNLYDLSIIHTSKGDKESTKIIGYGLSFESIIKTIINKEIELKHDTIDLKDYLIEFKSLLNTIKTELSNDLSNS